MRVGGSSRRSDREYVQASQPWKLRASSRFRSNRAPTVSPRPRWRSAGAARRADGASGPRDQSCLCSRSRRFACPWQPVARAERQVEALLRIEVGVAEFRPVACASGSSRTAPPPRPGQFGPASKNVDRRGSSQTRAPSVFSRPRGRHRRSAGVARPASRPRSRRRSDPPPARRLVDRVRRPPAHPRRLPATRTGARTCRTRSGGTGRPPRFRAPARARSDRDGVSNRQREGVA
jgi:hypothetical protein